jgi:hypothetical protein
MAGCKSNTRLSICKDGIGSVRDRLLAAPLGRALLARAHQEGPVAAALQVCGPASGPWHMAW